MIVYHKNNEIDREQWDNCIKNSSILKPYAFSWYLDIIVPGWQALVDDDYDSVFPVPGSSRFGVHYVSTPLFLQQLGAYSPDKPVSKAIVEFIEYMPDIYRYIDLCIGQEVHIDGYKLTEKANFELDLSKTYEKLSEGFSNECRRNIEVAGKKGLELATDVTPDELIDFAIMEDLKNKSMIKLRDYQRLKILMNFCIKNKKGRIIGVRRSKRRLYFGLFLIEIHGNKTIGFVVNTHESITKRISYYVVNELIRSHSSTRTILDFAGFTTPSNDAFMESFGCFKVPYYRIFRNRLFWPVRIMK